MSRTKRVAVTSPQTRVALAARRGGVSVTSLDATALAEAARIRRRQLRVAGTTLVGAAALLVGAPAVLDLVPVGIRWGDVPVVWLAVAVLPYPLLAVLAFVQLRRAERAERR
jgi:hypothetical protein